MRRKSPRHEAAPDVLPIVEPSYPEPSYPPLSALVSEVRQVMAEWDRCYFVQNGRHWTPSAHKNRQLRELVEQHGAEEVIGRVWALFAGNLQFLDKPYDVATLYNFFDRLVPTEMPSLVESMKRMWRIATGDERVEFVRWIRGKS